jgi:opacity protein-like surface antigen
LKKISSLIILLAVLFAVTTTNAQPQMKIHVYGGYNVPLSGLAGNSNFPPTLGTTDRFLYMKSGFNAGADFKYFLGKKRNVGLLINAAYNGYSSGDLMSSGVGVGTYKLNNVRIGIGAEYDFLPKGKANPFIGIDLVGNFLSGKFTPDAGGTATTLNSASRFGFAIGAGLDIAVGKAWGFVIGAKYDMINLIGKKAYDSTVTPTANSYDLFDKASTFGGVSYNAINMSDIQLYGGVAFFFGQPKKMVNK